MPSKTQLFLAGGLGTAVLGGLGVALLQPRQPTDLPIASPTPTVTSPSQASPIPTTPTLTPSPANPASQAKPKQKKPEAPVASGSQSPQPTSASTPPPESAPAQPSQSASTTTLSEPEDCRVRMAVVEDPDPPLNVRSSPTTSSNVVGQLKNGTFITVVAEQGGWFQINVPIEGWVAKNNTQHTCSYKTQRVNFGEGNRSATISDRFIGAGSHRYLFQATKGQTLTVAVKEGSLPLIMTPAGKPLAGDPGAQQSGSWTGKLPATGDYVLMFDSNYKGYSYQVSVKID